ncbi:ornithine carbamoyltransferase, mitochondrial-like [Actinia tenebrosa]|uniref:ornithine carbamoyltransferase n=1 Tax=Actinia tenebrosa TaxID=6105 RepID=A0A6P8ISF1_ACTTE|nr:ornithine carbamoyltransferase, mitochondrial-like [Actinia tenebrosa]
MASTRLFKSSFQRSAKLFPAIISPLRSTTAVIPTRKISSKGYDHPFPSVKGRNFLTLKDFSSDEIRYFLWVAADLKSRFKERSYLEEDFKPLAGKSAALIFQKRSTRTRISAETALALLGAHPLFLTDNDIHLGVNECIYDTAKVLSGFCDLILARVYGQDDLDTLASVSSVPVISGLSDMYHPLQTLADLQTLQEYFGSVYERNVAWVGDGNNILHSIMMGFPKFGINLQIATPKGYEPDATVTKTALEYAAKYGSTIEMTNDPREACNNADVVVTDTWISMGQEEEAAERLKAFKGYQVNKELMALAKENACFLHCLPRHKEEVDEEVFYSDKSLVWQVAENRKWTVMAVMLSLLEDHTPDIPMPSY